MGIKQLMAHGVERVGQFLKFAVGRDLNLIAEVAGANGVSAGT